MLQKQEIEKKNVAPGAISDPSQLEGTAAAEPVYADEQISTLRFRPVEQRGIRAQLSGTLRAFQIPGDENQLLAGLVKEGDHVDVVGNWKVPESGTDHVTRVVLRDLLVLKGANPKVSGPKLASPDGSTSVVLALTDAQSQKLFFIQKNGDWWLELRPSEDASDSPEGVETAGTLLRDGLPAKQLSHISGNQGGQ
jgi:Flp pilus assembly protein CpaB